MTRNGDCGALLGAYISAKFVFNVIGEVLHQENGKTGQIKGVWEPPLTP
jgi:hypothetical protein